MGWHMRSAGRYFYYSQRKGNAVKKIYIGGGPLGDFAAQADRLKQHEKEQDRLRWEQQRQCIDEAVAAFEKLDAGANLMRDASLFAAGFHRADRRPWRKWRYGRRVLKRQG